MSETAFSDARVEDAAPDGEDYGIFGHLGAGEDWQPDDIDEVAIQRGTD